MILAALITVSVIAVAELAVIIDLYRTVKLQRLQLADLSDHCTAAQLAEADMRRTLSQKEEQFWLHLQKANDRGEAEGLRAAMMLETALRYQASRTAKEAVEAEALAKEYQIRLREYEDALVREAAEQPETAPQVVRCKSNNGASKELNINDPVWERIV